MKKISIGPMPLLKATLGILIKNPVIFFPFFCLACIQLLVLELIYFVPRFPLSQIFTPVITKTTGSVFLHYPYNYILLLKWFHGLEVWIYIFISCIFYAAAVQVIFLINSDKEINFREVFRKVLSSYFHLVVVMILAVISLQSISFCYRELLHGIFQAYSKTGIFHLIKLMVAVAGPFVEIFFASIVSAFIAFLIPMILIEQKKIIPALVSNFKEYSRSWLVIFMVILITEIPYLPFIMFHSARVDELLALKAPEMSGFFMIFSILFMLLIDAIQYTAITLCYLFRNEERS